MNAVIKKILLAGYKYIPEMHLRQPGFTYRAYWPLIKNEEYIKKIKEAGNSRCIYQNDLDKACFQHDMAYGYFKDLNKRTAADKAYYVILLKIRIPRWICFNCLNIFW